MKQLKRFIIRTNCEYSLVVEAATSEQALKKADKVDMAEWDEAWSETEAEEEE